MTMIGRGLGLVARHLLQGSGALRTAGTAEWALGDARAPAAAARLARGLSGVAAEDADRHPEGVRGMRGGTIVRVDETERLDNLLSKQRPSLPFSFIQRLVRNKKVRVLGPEGEWTKLVNPGKKVAGGATLHVQSKTFEETKDEAPVAETSRLLLSNRERRDLVGSVLLEHSDVIILNKPSGLAVQGGSLMGRHLDRMLHALVAEGEKEPLLVHRLDRQTSGCLAVARNRESAGRLAAAFRGDAGLVHKSYLAVVHPAPKAGFGCIDHAMEKVLGTEGQADRVQLVDRGGKRAVTEYEVLSRSPEGGALLLLTPRTGRTHQLRVHCAQALRCGIVGDAKYAAGQHGVRDRLGSAYRERYGFDRLCLHAHVLRIRWQGGSGRGGEEAVEARAPVPRHIWAAMDRLGIPVPAILQAERDSAVAGGGGQRAVGEDREGEGLGGGG